MSLYSDLHAIPYKSPHAMSLAIESPGLEPEEINDDISPDKGCSWFGRSMMAPFRMIAQCIYAKWPQNDNPGMLNAVVHSDEEHIGQEFMRFGKLYDSEGNFSAKCRNQKESVSETSSLLIHPEGRQTSNYTNPKSKIVQDQSKDAEYIKAVNQKTQLGICQQAQLANFWKAECALAIQQKIDQRCVEPMKRATTTIQPRPLKHFTKTVQSSDQILVASQQRCQAAKQKVPSSRGISDESSSTGLGECFSDADYAIESYETILTDTSIYLGCQHNNQKVAKAPHTADKRETPLFKKSPLRNVETRTSFLSLALSQGREQEQQRVSAEIAVPPKRSNAPIAAGQNVLPAAPESRARIVAGENLIKVLGVRRVDAWRTLEKGRDEQTLRTQDSLSRAQKRKMESFIVEGRKTSIPIFKDPTIDGDTRSRRLINWMDNHDLSHIFFPK